MGLWLTRRASPESSFGVESQGGSALYFFPPRYRRAETPVIIAERKETRTSPCESSAHTNGSLIRQRATAALAWRVCTAP